MLRARARREVARLDRLTPARTQLHILLGLLHDAQATPFGREHDFQRIRTEADFRRLVPLQTTADLQRQQAATPSIRGAKNLRTARRAAWEAAVAFIVGARPQARLLSGRFVVLSAEENSGVAMPWLLRPYVLHDTKTTAETLVQTPVTCLCGSAEEVAALLDRALRITGRERATEIWPGLAAVLYTRESPTDGPAPRLRSLLDDSVLLLETHSSPAGPVAVEDPRAGCLSLLFGHGAYFEFTPAAEAGKLDAARHGLDEVEPGVVYEMTMSSLSGVWACRTGMAVRFERRGSPLFRWVEMPAPAPVVESRKLLIRPACPPQAPHRHIAGIPAAPPEKFAHIPWSTHAGRG